MPGQHVLHADDVLRAVGAGVPGAVDEVAGPGHAARHRPVRQVRVDVLGHHRLQALRIGDREGDPVVATRRLGRVGRESVKLPEVIPVAGP